MSEAGSNAHDARRATQTSARLLGVEISNATASELSGWVHSALQGCTEPQIFACANPHSLVVAGEDEWFLRALQGSSVVVADGAGIRVGALLAGQQVGPRITGYDFFTITMRHLNARAGHAYFFGSSNRVLGILTRKVSEDYPNVRVTAWSPPFRDWTDSENDEMIAAIRDSDAHVLWVGMTAPKQEKWAYGNAARLNVPLIGCIGAVFDYYAGTVVRAPAPWRAAGLEWLYRLARDPRRLWRRTLISAPIFLWRCVRQRMTA